MKSILNSICSLAMILMLCNLSVVAQDWNQWRGPARDGKVAGFKAPQTWPDKLTQTWKVPAGLSDATPALVNGRIYIYSKVADNEVLQCFDAQSGKQLWQSPGYPAPVVSGPAASHPGPRSSVSVSDGKVVTVGVAGDIACFDASTGKLLWRNEDYKGQVPQFFTGMSPLVYSGVCYAHLGGPNTGTFVAFDLASGSIKWKVDGEGPAYGSPVMMTIGSDKHLIFQSMTKIVSFNPADGKLLWEIATPVGTGRVQNSTTPVVDGNKIYYTGLNNGVNAAEVKKEGNTWATSPLWTNPEFSTSYNTPVLKDGFLYGLSNQNRLFCINASNGQTAWRDDTALQNFGSIVDAGSVLVVVTSNSFFIALKPDGQKYNQLAMIMLPETGIYSHPILSGDRIYIKDKENLTLYTVK